ncbi:hypothetical protein GNI_086490 [Gregarina niphandrodes]|uniref:Uncharacterized protein n=1 Tax=Gregarina niphandrodes TaxID=110365 RepID=A0A023B5X4_GRENI|nr:hypothetical protein GNI_086490 [Gregarina niphandrodes]EZG63623.1 hypothetical protein GNI_086490 [Gregarina niphandrodes]|eukprot:XP_011130663.1 hypothetical protein GNI_086490 [Gregarina niphandrodes]
MEGGAKPMTSLIDDRENEKLVYSGLGLRPASLDISCGDLSKFYCSEESHLNKIWGGGELKRLTATKNEDGSMSVVIVTNPLLIVTTYSGVQGWQNSCVCKNLCSEKEHCKRICFYSGVDEETNEMADIWVVSYASLNAQGDKLCERKWRAVILENSSTIPLPHSCTIKNLLRLKCADWVTVNYVNHKSEFSTSWMDIHRQAQLFQRHTQNWIQTPIFWKYVESGYKGDIGPERHPATYALLHYLHDWIERDSIKVSRPAKIQLEDVLQDSKENQVSLKGTPKGTVTPRTNRNRQAAVWVVTVTPDTNDLRRLEALKTIHAGGDWEQTICDYFKQPQRLPDVTQSSCFMCGCPQGEVYMVCCRTWLHKGCLSTELQVQERCPKCRVAFRANEHSISRRLLESDSQKPVLLDPSRQSAEVHDWSLAGTLSTMARSIAEHCGTRHRYEFLCPTQFTKTIDLMDPESVHSVQLYATPVPSSSTQNSPLQERNSGLQETNEYDGHIWFLTPDMKVSTTDVKGHHVLVYIYGEVPTNRANWKPLHAVPKRQRIKILY